MSLHICPGCQGRNAPDADICDWCGQPFRASRGPLILQWWHLVAVALIGAVLLAVGGLFLVGGSRLDPRTLAAPQVGPIAAPPAPTLAPAVPAAPAAPLPTPISQPKPGSSPTPVQGNAAQANAVASPAAPPAPAARYVRVANTGGLGVYLRQEPGPQGERVQPALAEGAVLRLVGPEETVQAQIWRLCELDGRSIQGWVPALYLQATDVAPTPAPRP